MSLGLKQKHSQNLHEPAEPVDARKIIGSQSMPGAILAGAVAMLITSWGWILLTGLFDRFFPWFVLLQGVLIGLAMRRWGKGFDWPYLLAAALMAAFAAYSGSFLIAASAAADELGVSMIRVIFNMSDWTLGLYFDEDVSSVDHIYAVCASCVAAFLSSLKLNRAEEFAVRTLRDNKAKKKKAIQ